MERALSLIEGVRLGDDAEYESTADDDEEEEDEDEGLLYELEADDDKELPDAPLIGLPTGVP